MDAEYHRNYKFLLSHRAANYVGIQLTRVMAIIVQSAPIKAYKRIAQATWVIRKKQNKEH